MFFNDTIQRRLASLLHPWLRQEPELDLKLGFLRSHGIAKNLRFDTSALNQLLDEPTRFYFKDVRVEQLSVRISLCSVPAFTIEVRGVDVTLSVGEPMEERCSKRMQKSTDMSSEDLKKTLSVIDPQGCALHDIMERISVTTSSGNWLTTSFMNLILKHCRLQMHDVHLKLQFPMSNDSSACLLELKELNSESQCIEYGCFLRGLVCALFVPLKVSSISLDVRGFEIGLERKDCLNRVLPSTDMFTCIKLKDLQLIEFNLCVPELCFSFSPVDLLIILAFDKLSSKEYKLARNGRQLWNIVASRIGYLISNPGLKLYKLVGVVCLWLRYVNGYEYFLLLVGYSTDNLLKRSTMRMSRDAIFSRSVKNQWKVISKIEKELPAEAIVQARRIARYRAALNVQRAKNSCNESPVNRHFKFFWKILPLLAFIWAIICTVFYSIARCLFLRTILVKHHKIDDHLGVVSEDSCPQRCFSLNVGKISITVSPIDAVQPPVGGKLISEIFYSDLLSFCLSVDALFLIYTEDICEESFSFSCGHLQVISSAVMGAPVLESSSKNYNISLKGQWKDRANNSKTILWGEPAQMFALLENTRTGSANDSEGARVPLLENPLGEMWLNWKRSCMEFERRKIHYVENPCLLCEIKNSLMDPGFKNPDSGFWKCSLTVGKLNVAMGYSSILSIALLVRQIQHALCWTDGSGRAKILSHSPKTFEDPPEINWDSRCKSYASGMKMAMVRMLPEKHIQLGVLITGPHIRMSLRKEVFHGGNAEMSHVVSQDDFHFAVNIHDIELAVWPTSKSDFTTSNGRPGLDDAEPERLRLKEPRRIDIPKSYNENYISQGRISLDSYLRVYGLDAYLEDSAENRECQIIALKPTIVQLSSFREYLHSFSTTVVACSAALCGMAKGFTVLFCMDELSVFFQVVVALFSAASYAFTHVDLIGGLYCQEFTRQDVEFTKPDNKETLAITGEGASLIFKSAMFVINGTFELNSMDIILHNSRKGNNMESCMKTFVASSSKKLTQHYVPDYGIWISVQQTCIEISHEEGKVEVLTDFSGIQSVMFRDQSQIGKSTDRFEFRNLLLQSLNCLYEISLSKCNFTLWLGSPQNTSSSGSVSSAVDGSTSGGRTSYMIENSPSPILTESSSIQSFGFVQKLGFASNIPVPTSSHWLLINIALSEIFVVGCAVKKVLVGAHQPNKLHSSLSVGGENQKISWGVQGGFFFLETTAMVMLVRCFASYLHCTTNLFSVVPSSDGHIEIAESGEDMTRPSEYTQETLNTFGKAAWELLEAFTIDLSQFSLVLVVAEESGGIRELVLGADVHLNLELANMRRKFLFKLSRLSILSQILQKSVEQETNEIRISHFSSVTSNDLSSHSISGDPTTDRIRSVVDDASCSSAPVSQKESFGNNCVSQVFHLSRQNFILKQLGAFISVEKPVPGDENGPLCLNQVWVGRGSVSGFDMTISLSEIQMLLSIVASLSEVSSKEATGNMKQRHWSSNRESDSSLEVKVPDGAIVAIRDVHQHMYFTVEGVDNKYSLAGAIHYSLAGERALFRVKYHNQRRWKSSVSWFSLISLHAKSDSGEPLRLNYRPGSGFVDISSTNDGGWALWRILSYKPENFEGDIDLEPYNQLAKNTFYLVNKKNDCAIAFVNGVPEFVRRPGNPFKLKVFHDLSLAREVVMLDSYSVEGSGTNLQHKPHLDNVRSGQSGNLPRIDVTIDKVTLTIVHELSDTMYKFPLLRGCIRNIEFIVQILSSKARVISTLRAMMYYFDAQKNLWRELVHPVEICIFYRSRFQIQRSDMVLQGVLVNFYLRIKELDISLTELSLDILLFVIGKLNLAGPYAVRISMILANCCKVENQTGLNLLCQFYDNEVATIAQKQSASIFLRHLALAEQPPEASFVSIQLAVLGAFSTSPIHLSLLKDRALAWRTRIVSLQGSRTYPGPFVVVDISRKTEDGLLITVSPLLRIHNETEFPMELRFQRPQQKEAELASVVLKTGDTIDDCISAFDAINFSGGLKKALMSLSVGNFIFSFRPEITDDLRNLKKSLSVEWSDDLKGGKAVPLSGIFDKLSYKVRKAFSVESSIGRNVPLIQPDNFGSALESRNSLVALQEQKEIFLLPTVRVSNLLQLEIRVLLTETDLCAAAGCNNIGNQATIPCGSTVDLYANPAIIYFTVTLTEFSSSCKPVNSGDWVKKLHKQKKDFHCLDIDLNFGGGKYFASLRLSRGHRGILEAAIFTPYTLKNDTDFPLFCFAPNQKPLSWDEADKFGSSFPPELGSFLPPKSTRSWFMKSNKVRLKLLEEKASEALLDLDALSGLTEISLEMEEGSGIKHIAKLGVSLGPSTSKVLPSHLVSMVPRYAVLNESEEVIFVRQCYMEDDMEGVIAINGKQKTALQLRNGTRKKREINLFDNFLRKHRNANDDSLIYIQFRLNETGLGWSGPVCIASLGRFFLKFRRSLDFPAQQSNQVTALEKKKREVAAVHVVEQGSTLVLHFYRLLNINLPYRIENHLHEASITYYQKDSYEPEILGSGSSVDYVWDDLTLPHKLVVQINGMQLFREINLDKVRDWKPFFKVRQHRVLAFHLPLDKKPGDQRTTNRGESNDIEMVKVGYEVYADGPTRVLRICEFPDSHKGDTVFQSRAKIQIRASYFAIHLLEHGKQDVDATGPSNYTPIVIARLGNSNLDSLFTDQHKYNQIRVQSLNVDQKWEGAPFAAMLRRHPSEYGDANDDILHIVFILLSTSSNVKQIKHSSIVLKPVDLNLDEETLMRIVPFWRTSLSDSNTQSQQFYFDHFEVHPIKIIASFLPGDLYSSYNSAQETLRSLLHSVIKIPAIKNMVVELNGVLVTHALISIRELFIKCAQHYSWYAMRAIYIAKGSPLLPPAFASIFDDSASSSLDIFFDPSSGSINLPGLTLGTFKLISKCIDRKGFSGTKRYFGDLGKTLRTAGSNILFAAVTEISDSVLKGAETSGINGMVSGFHQGILKLAMEPSLLGTAFMEGGPDRKINLDRSPGVDELYIEGYLQAMLDTIYKQEYLRVRVIDNEVFLKNLPPNSSLIDEIMDRVKGFLVSKALLKGDSSTTSRPLRHLRGESEWKIGPTVLTLCEHLFVSFAIRMLRKQAGKVMARIKRKGKSEGDDRKAIVPASTTNEERKKLKFIWRWEIGKFVLSGMVAYIDGRLCRCIPNPVARRIVSGFLLSFLDKNDND